ncbi:MAG: peptidylprolyl isomerase [Planctomycetes bacterium]|nr:peptidylprolyl isomerase [Planctomycetota bacterium]
MTSAIGWMTACGVFGVIVANSAGGETSAATSGLHPRVKMETTLGTVVIELDGDKAPRTVSNFVSYVENRFFDGTIFHRVLDGGLIQGGAFDATMDRKIDGLRDGVKCEWDNGLKNVRGTIAMYRISNFLDSAKAEFFINLRDSPGLDDLHRDGAAYTVFGAVVEGLDAVDKIAAVPVGTHAKYAKGRSKVVPIDPVVIKSMRMLSAFDHQRAVTMAEAEEIRQKKAKEEAAQAKVRALRERIENLEAQSGQKMVTTESGLGYIIMRPGQGAPPIESETVTVHYRGTFANGTVFEESYGSETAKPLTQKVSRFISGLREGILGMHEGGKRFFVVPPEIGFGTEGVPDRIPPNSTLVYVVELLAIEDE